MDNIVTSEEDEKNFLLFLISYLHKYIKINKIEKKFIVNLKLQKIIFNFLEDVDIPVTRSWYLYGGYVHSDLLTTENVWNFDIKHPEVKFEKFASFEYRIKRILEMHINDILYKPQVKYLQNFYQNAPEPFKELYLSNLDYNHYVFNFIKLLRVKKQNPNFNHEEIYNRNMNKLINIYFKLIEIPDLNKIFHHANEIERAFEEFIYVTKDALYKIELLLKKKKMRQEQFQFLINDFSEIYRQFIWKSVALNISIKTIKGFSRVKYKNRQKTTLNHLLKTINLNLKEWEDNLELYNLLSTTKELKKLIRGHGNKVDFSELFEIWHFVERKEKEK